MKLVAGGAQDDEDIRNLFLIMSESEKQEAFQLAKMIGGTGIYPKFSNAEDAADKREESGVVLRRLKPTNAFF